MGYRALVGPTRVWLPVRAFVKVTIAGDKLTKFAALVRTLPEVLECHRVTGAESFMVQVAVREVKHMEAVIDSMMPYVATNTSMIMGSPVPWNKILPAVCHSQRARPQRPSKGWAEVADRRHRCCPMSSLIGEAQDARLHAPAPCSCSPT
ncbi:MAG: Lrp/AsnC family transcriptional regulator [Edaphobacter sp.]